MFLCLSLYDQNFQKSKFIPEKNPTSEFTVLFSENTWNSIRSQIVRVVTYLLGFKARLHQWEKIWSKAIKYQDMTFGSGRTWSELLAWLVLRSHWLLQDPFPVLQRSSASPALDKWGGLTQEKPAYATFFYVLCRLMFAGDCSHPDMTQNYGAK